MTAENATRQLDPLSKRRLAWLLRRAEQLLGAAAAAAPDGRAEVHVILVQQGDLLTRQSRVVPAPEHAPE